MATTPLTNTSGRLTTIDLLRGLTMLLMLLVNDYAGVRGLPHWFYHAASNEDMLGISDIVFPAFLFALGLSIPFALQKRIERGDSLLSTTGHILLRSAALVVMGLFTVNLENYGGGPLSYPVWEVLMIVGFFLVWNDYPRTEKPARKGLWWVLRAIGVALLFTLFLLYEGHEGAPFQQHWWGILGLIGWTYLVCALLYMVVRRSLWVAIGVWVVVVLLAFLQHSGISPLSFVPSDWTLHAFGMTGIVVSMLLRHNTAKGKSPKQFIIILCVAAVVMFVGYLLCHPHWIISKIQATPTWLCLCLAIFLPAVALIYALTDMRGKHHIPRWIAPAGSATLTCYMIPYLWYGIDSLLGIPHPAALWHGAPGFFRALIFALLCVWIAGALSKVKIKLKL